MSGRILAISIGYTTFSLIVLLWRSNLVLSESLLKGSVSVDNEFHPGQETHILELLLESNVSIMLLANIIVSMFFSSILCLKMLFFGHLSILEARKMVEHLINYAIHKGVFLPLIVRPELFHVAFWTTWLMVICCLKFFEVLAEERLERLNASPSSTPWMCFRVYLVLFLVLFSDLFWIVFCLSIYKASESSPLLIFLFEPLSIVFEATKAIMVHGLQLIETYSHFCVNRDVNCNGNRLLNTSGLEWGTYFAGSLLEWKGVLIRNFGFLMDVMALLMALGHYVYILWLHGPSFHVVDAMLLLNLGGVLATLVKRIKGFIKLRLNLKSLQGALPDATTAEIVDYNDECAICKEPMVNAKKLTCKHLFHLSCLRAWLDQSMGGTYSCPTCRRPLVMRNHIKSTNYQGRQVPEDGQLVRRMSSELDDTITGREVEGGVNIQQEVLRNSSRSSWIPWRMRRSRMNPGAPPPNTSSRHTGNFRGLRMRNPSRPGTESMTRLLSMADTVREVLPHIPHEIILQDLLQTHSATVTVNNLLHL